MANEYEIKSVGFIGSLWQGEFNTPLLVGETLQVTNLTTLLNGNGFKSSIYFASNENLDIDKLTSQIPESNLYFKVGKLNQSEIDDLKTSVYLNPEFSKNTSVLFRYTAKYGEIINASRLPLQFNWSFDSSNSSNPKVLYDIPEAITYANYVFLVDSTNLQYIRDYFSKIESRVSILDPVIDANPNVVQSSTTQTISQAVSIPPNISTSIFRTPPADIDLVSELAAVDQFDAEKQNYTISNLSEFNSKSKKIETEISSLISFGTQSPGPMPFSDMLAMATRVKLLKMLKNYMLEQLSLIHKVPLPHISPDNYTVATNGDVVILSPDKPLRNTPLQTDTQSDIDEFDEFIDEIIDDLSIDDNHVYVNKKLSKISDYATPIIRHKTYGMFKCEGERIVSYYTGSVTTKNSKYYLPISSRLSPDVTYHQFDISYGHRYGSGSSYVELGQNLLPAKTIFRKYLLECFGTNAGSFPFKNGVNGNYIYTIQLDRDAFKSGLDIGNFELALAPLSSSINQSVNTGSGFFVNPSSSATYTLIDSSNDGSQRITDVEGSQEYYYLVSGSLRDGVYSNEGDNAWGMVFPKMGLIVLDGVVLDQSCSFNTVTGSIDGDNIRKLFVSISGSSTPTLGRTTTSSFFARSIESDLFETYFCRANPDEFNYSSNYTYTSGSNGFLRYSYLADNPISYITTIGLYNKHNELLAVGKVRTPLLKNTNTTYTFQVRVKLN